MDGPNTMNKTRVRLSPSLLEYRQAMAELVDEAREEVLLIAAGFDDTIEPIPRRPDIPAPATAGLLQSPRIESLWPELWIRDGRADGLIQINTSDGFGILYIYITLRDQAGSLLESGYAMFDEFCEGHWGYIPEVDLPAGTSVVVRALAVDALGAMGMAQEMVTVEER
jgi:hypothetical protein